jgi:hypothetical protein
MTQTDEARIGEELRPGEKLLWSGRPQRGFLFHPASILLIISLLLIVGLIYGLITLHGIPQAIRIIEIVTAAARQRFTTTGLIAGLLVLFGLVAIWGFVFYPLQRRRTVYALTDQRAIIIPGLSSRRARSFELGSLNFTALTRLAGRRATIIFGAYPAHYAGMGGEQKQKVMNTWKWFGYRFDRFEIGQSAGNQSPTPRHPAFGRFEYIDHPGQVYSMLRQTAGIRPSQAAGEAAVQPLPVTTLVEGIVRRPGIITFIIDTSGSMQGEKMTQARRGLVGALSMAGDNQVGLLAFDSTITTHVGVAPLAQQRRALTSTARHMEAGGGSTALYDALKRGIEMTDIAVGGDEDMRAVVVLTDGHANAGTARLDDIIELKSHGGSAIRLAGFWKDDFADAQGHKIDKADVLGAGLAMKTDHPVQIYFIGIGADADMEIGRMLAEATGAGAEKGIELPSGDTVARVTRVREVDLARVLEEFKYF